jgi:hypothetical protein
VRLIIDIAEVIVIMMLGAFMAISMAPIDNRFNGS